MLCPASVRQLFTVKVEGGGKRKRKLCMQQKELSLLYKYRN